MAQSTIRKPVVKNFRRALCVQFTIGLMVYYGVSLAGYWAYGSEVPDYLPEALSGPNWAKVLINSAVFLQNIISQHVCAIFLVYPNVKSHITIIFLIADLIVIAYNYDVSCFSNQFMRP